MLKVKLRVTRETSLCLVSKGEGNLSPRFFVRWILIFHHQMEVRTNYLLGIAEIMSLDSTILKEPLGHSFASILSTNFDLISSILFY